MGASRAAQGCIGTSTACKSTQAGVKMQAQGFL